MQYILILFGWLTAVGIYQDNKPLPDGVIYRSETHYVDEGDIEFLADLTYEDSKGNIIHEQEIYDTIESLVDSAKNYVHIDMFLFNSFLGPANYSYRDITKELTQSLIEKKILYPDIKIDFISDPLNALYGGYKAPELRLLKSNGINLILTDLRKIRDNTYLYSPVWRTFVQWFGNTNEGGKFKNPLIKDGDKVTLRSYLAFGNLKANHRKVMVTDYGNDMISLITSHNSHSASSDFSNVGLLVKGNIFKDILFSEGAIAKFSGADLQYDSLLINNYNYIASDSTYKVTFLTEKEIHDELYSSFKELGKGDSLMLAAFYLSKRSIVKSILKAAKNGADVRIILDPNKDGFGYEKYGTPNQPVSAELLKKSDGKIQLKWYLTHGEQFHTKFNYIRYIKGTSKVLLGNSNLTKKNLGGYNLEAEFMVDAPSDSPLIKEINEYYERMWNNHNGDTFTVDYDTFKDDSFKKKLSYRFREATGIAVY